MKFDTAKEFYDWCKERRACPGGLRAIKDKTAARWWSTTRRSDWMFWLHDKGAWNCSENQWAEFGSIAEIAWDRYLRAFQQAYGLTLDRAALEYHREIANALRKIVGNPFKKKGA